MTWYNWSISAGFSKSIFAIFKLFGYTLNLMRPRGAFASKNEADLKNEDDPKCCDHHNIWLCKMSTLGGCRGKGEIDKFNRNVIYIQNYGIDEIQ